MSTLISMYKPSMRMRRIHRVRLRPDAKYFANNGLHLSFREKYNKIQCIVFQFDGICHLMARRRVCL